MSGRVLVVDDSLTIRMDLTMAFEAAGIDTCACSSIREAREALAREQFPLVVLDMLLPDGEGIDLLPELRDERHPRAWVVMLSTEAELRDRMRGMSSGADEYLAKPYDVEYLVGRARELVRGRAPVGPAERPSILVIDDSPTFREALGTALRTSGYDVLLAESGEIGLRVAAHARPTAIIVDGVLPGIDGPAVIRRVRLDATLRTTPCILLTGSGRRNDELDALDAGADGFAHKEADMSVVLARLAAVLRGATATASSAGSVLSQKKVLAVDDSVTYLQSLGALLRGDGYDVVLAASGEEALELLPLHPVDCILLDVMMPGLGGRETCARIKSAPTLRDTPLIMLTGLEDRDSMLGCLAAGADDYISKSSDPAVLRARVRAQIRRRQFESEARRVREELLAREREAAESMAARQIAEARAAMADELARRNRELEAFSYSVSHDLRAPLRGIDGFGLALLEDYGDRLDARGLDYLERIRSSAQRMGELIDDLLSLAKVTRADISLGVLDVSALAASVVAELRARHPSREIEVVIAPALTVRADARLMRAVVENLLGNAWKFTGKAAAARIEVGACADGFYVRDNGAGFDMRYATKLFQAFQRLHSEQEFEGTGIGLATVHRIIERHGGRIGATSELGRGATFEITLPSS
jgi:two-component system NtrC family sensor kinase